MDFWLGDQDLVRLCFQRGLAAIYFIAFVSARNQFPALLGERGLLPVPRFLAQTSFWSAPSIFHLRYSDRIFAIVVWAGIGLSFAGIVGVLDFGPVWLSIAGWLILWALYVSIVNVGQTFYGFGWESMLCEAGFFAAFLGPIGVEPSVIPLLALRWMLFRTELGAGLIKLRHDPCWRDLTCLIWHHETQPMPNPLSRVAHRLPRWSHKCGVMFSHIVQLVVPFALFAPQPVASIAGALIIAHQLLLVLTGNYAWLNWLTIVLGFTAFSDDIIASIVPVAMPATLARSLPYDIVLWVLAAVTLALSVQPILNFFSPRQKMNYSWNPLHLVNAYGAFGSVTRERYEVVIEGRDDDGRWHEYEFRGKPGDPRRRPPQVAPYHLRLDWLMWFLPLSVIRNWRVVVWGHERWFIRLVDHLLTGDPGIKKLLGRDPFPDRPPCSIRARLYRYHFADPSEHVWWQRELVGEYLPTVTLQRPG